MEPEPNRILIVKLGGIGDLLQMTPCLPGLRQRYPQAYIAFLVQEYAREAVATHPLLDESLVAGNLGTAGFREIPTLIQLIRLLRSRRFDLAIVANKTHWLAAALHLAGIPRRVGFAFPGRWHGYHRAIPFDGSRNLLDLHLDLFALVGAPRTPGRPFFHIPAADRGTAAERLEGLGVPGAFVTSSPGGGVTPWVNGYAKRWEPDRFAELFDRVYRDHGVPTVLLGGREDRQAVDRVLARVRCPIIDLVGQLPLAQTAAILARSRLYVGNDSALLYLAGAVGTPSIGIFGPTDPREFLPPDPLFQEVHRSVPCSPCWNQLLGKRSPALRCDHVSCMKAVTVDDVYERVGRCLEAIGGDDSQVRGHIAKVEQ